jgi:hypothetical protein
MKDRQWLKGDGPVEMNKRIITIRHAGRHIIAEALLAY